MPVMQAKPSIAEAFDKFQKGELDGDKEKLDFIKEPYLELATAYETVKENENLAALATIGLLDEDVANAFAKYLLDDKDANPEKVRLYVHQLESLKAVNAGMNLVVSTGTGSGKTECFLLPIVNEIVKQRKQARQEGRDYSKHVRALILYPMNALVNDQIRRLRKLVRFLPRDLAVTFGRYTSETDHRERAMQQPTRFRELWKQFADNEGGAPRIMEDTDIAEDEDFLPSEYRYRSRWKKDGGADILVTNYSMLERLLLMPDDRGGGMFDSPWDFIVLDEAHSYSGAAGTEIAWLVRRLVNRLHRQNPEHPIRFLATSATLSTGEDCEQELKTFASELFPATANSFSVQAGTVQRPSMPTMTSSGDADPDFFQKDMFIVLDIDNRICQYPGP